MLLNFSLIIFFSLYLTVTLFFVVDYMPYKILYKGSFLYQTEAFQQPALSKDKKAAIKIADSVIASQMKNCPHKLTIEQRSLKSYDITVTTLQKNTNSFEVNYKLKQGKKDGPIPAFTVIVNISTRETEFKGMN